MEGSSYVDPRATSVKKVSLRGDGKEIRQKRGIRLRDAIRNERLTFNRQRPAERGNNNNSSRANAVGSNPYSPTSAMADLQVEPQFPPGDHPPFFAMEHSPADTRRWIMSDPAAAACCTSELATTNIGECVALLHKIKSALEEGGGSGGNQFDASCRNTLEEPSMMRRTSSSNSGMFQGGGGGGRQKSTQVFHDEYAGSPYNDDNNNCSYDSGVSTVAAGVEESSGDTVFDGCGMVGGGASDGRCAANALVRMSMLPTLLHIRDQSLGDAVDLLDRYSNGAANAKLNLAATATELVGIIIATAANLEFNCCLEVFQQALIADTGIKKLNAASRNAGPAVAISLELLFRYTCFAIDASWRISYTFRSRMLSSTHEALGSFLHALVDVGALSEASELIYCFCAPPSTYAALAHEDQVGSPIAASATSRSSGGPLSAASTSPHRGSRSNTGGDFSAEELQRRALMRADQSKETAKLLDSYAPLFVAVLLRLLKISTKQVSAQQQQQQSAEGDLGGPTGGFSEHAAFDALYYALRSILQLCDATNTEHPSAAHQLPNDPYLSSFVNVQVWLDLLSHPSGDRDILCFTLELMTKFPMYPSTGAVMVVSSSQDDTVQMNSQNIVRGMCSMYPGALARVLAGLLHNSVAMVRELVLSVLTCHPAVLVASDTTNGGDDDASGPAELAQALLDMFHSCVSSASAHQAQSSTYRIKIMTVILTMLEAADTLRTTAQPPPPPPVFQGYAHSGSSPMRQRRHSDEFSQMQIGLSNRLADVGFWMLGQMDLDAVESATAESMGMKGVSTCREHELVIVLRHIVRTHNHPNLHGAERSSYTSRNNSPFVNSENPCPPPPGVQHTEQFFEPATATEEEYNFCEADEEGAGHYGGGGFSFRGQQGPLYTGMETHGGYSGDGDADAMLEQAMMLGGDYDAVTADDFDVVGNW